MADKKIEINLNPESPLLKSKQDVFDNGTYVSLIDNAMGTKQKIDISKEQLLLLGKQIAENQTFNSLMTDKKEIVNAINEIRSFYQLLLWKTVGISGDYRTWEYNCKTGYEYRVTYNWNDASTDKWRFGKRVEFVVDDALKEGETFLLEEIVLDETVESLALKLSKTGVFIDPTTPSHTPSIKGVIVKLEERLNVI